MRDRTPTRALENGALRYGVYAEDGSLLRYEYLALEDDPTDPGTELSKATLLQDSTEVSLFGSAADRTVDEAFAGIAGQLKLIKSDSAAITLTIQDANGKPIPGVLVQGILSENGSAVYTDDSGVVSGYIAEGKTPVKVSGYVDIVPHTETFDIIKGTTVSKTMVLSTVNFLAVKSSRSLVFSGNVSTIDFSVTSGGGGGYFNHTGSGGGGAGGGTVTKQGVTPTPNSSYKAIIGSGGNAGLGASYGTAPGKGGESSFMGISAPGGNPGSGTAGGAGQSGGGSGGNGRTSMGVGAKGGNSTATAFVSFTETSNLGGGGGGGPYGQYQDAGRGGSVGGGDGGYSGKSEDYDEPGHDGEANTGGGGGGAVYDPNRNNGGAGGSGYIGIRMHLKSAA